MNVFFKIFIMFAMIPVLKYICDSMVDPTIDPLTGLAKGAMVRMAFPDLTIAATGLVPWVVPLIFAVFIILDIVRPKKPKYPQFPEG